jgi:uncharacterized protein YcbK (DUF882 family)
MVSHSPSQKNLWYLDRRRFITSVLSCASLLIAPTKAFSTLQLNPDERKLHLFNPKSKTRLETTFWADGAYIPSALEEIDFLMRDLRNGKIKPIDRRLIDLLYAIQTDLELSGPFHVISGFRSRETNERLRKQGWAAAKNSLHIRGKAVDIRHAEASTDQLRRVAFKLKQGGVGYYPRLNFIHVDIGPVRYWRKE